MVFKNSKQKCYCKLNLLPFADFTKNKKQIETSNSLPVSNYLYLDISYN